MNIRSLNKLGVVLHVSGSRRLILRTSLKVKARLQVFDEDLKLVGKMVDIFGPVKNPYVAVKPSVDNLESYVGRSLYIVEERERKS